MGSFLESMRIRLEERKDELLRLVNGQESAASGREVKDSGDEALSASMDKLQDSIQQAEIDELNSINHAIARIDRGTYGNCVDCDEKISERRLSYYPYAARCILCQEKQEQFS